MCLKMSRARRSSECPRVRYSRQNASSSSGRGLGVGVTGYRIRSAQALHSAPSPNPTADPGSGQYASARLISARGASSVRVARPSLPQPPRPAEPVVGARRLRERIVDVCAIERLDRRRDAGYDAIERHRDTASPASATPSTGATVTLTVREFDVVAGSHPHDVAPAPDGGVWYTGQHDGTLGHLDPATGSVRTIPLGAGSAPHGVITGPDGNAWITDGGLNAIVRVDADTDEVTTFPLPSDRPGANLNTAVFDTDGILWFTGQTGIFGRLDPATGSMEVFDDPEGRGPYGITSTPSGTSGTPRSPAATSRTSTGRPGRRPSSSRRRRTRAPAGSGRIPVAGSGSASGTRARSACTTRRQGSGRSGRSPATGRRPTPSTSTIGTSSG